MTQCRKSQEPWENLTRTDLECTDPATVELIRSLLRAVVHQPNAVVCEATAERAMGKLYELTAKVILAKCRSELGRNRNGHSQYLDHAEDLASRIFLSLAIGEPFLSAAPYKTWLEKWDPDKGPLIALVLISTESLSRDWKRSQRTQFGNVDTDIRGIESLAATESDNNANPERVIEAEWLHAKLEQALAAMPSKLNRNAFVAIELRGMTPKDHALQNEIAVSAVYDRLKAAKRWIGNYFIENKIMVPRGSQQDNRVHQFARGASARAEINVPAIDKQKES